MTCAIGSHDCPIRFEILGSGLDAEKLMRKRRAAPSFLIPLGGPAANAAGLGALSRKRRAAPSFLVHLAACKPLGFGSVQAAAGQLGAAGLIPRGGPDAKAAGLGALRRRLSCALGGLGWRAQIRLRADAHRAVDLGATRDPVLLADGVLFAQGLPRTEELEALLRARIGVPPISPERP